MLDLVDQADREWASGVPDPMDMDDMTNDQIIEYYESLEPMGSNIWPAHPVASLWL